jgi:integrase
VAKGKINISTVESLKAGQTIWDTAVAGFGARRQLSNVSYVVKYRHRGQQRFVTIGRHGRPWTPDLARKEARRLLGLVAGGGDPSRVPTETLGKVIEDYLKYAQGSQRPRSYIETKRHLLINWEPLHRLGIGEVRRRDIAERLAELVQKGQVTAAAARAALSAMFNWAIREGLEITTNPVQGTNRPTKPVSRSRVLTDAELGSIWNACGDGDYGRIVRLLMLTGQRRDEVGGMRWAEIDLERRLWTIPGARTKNHLEHRLPLSPLAVAILAGIPAWREFVFGQGPKGFSGSSGPKAALDARIGIADWRLHDLRRTVATVMADRLGVLPHVIEAVLNHVSGHRAGVAGVYNRAKYEVEMRTALDKWAAHIEGITVGFPDNPTVKSR